jgi:hypothetical protein
MAVRIRLVGSALALVVLMTGCAGRHQLSMSGPRLLHTPHAMDMSAGEAAPDWVKDAIRSPGRELKRGGSEKPQRRAALRTLAGKNRPRQE